MMGSVVRGGVTVVLGLAMLATTAGAQTLPTTPLGYAVFALEGVRIGALARVQGAVGTNAGEVMVRAGARIDGPIAGATLVIRRGAGASAFFCVQVQGGRK